MRVALCYDPLRFFPRCYDLFFLDFKLNYLVVIAISISESRGLTWILF